MALLNGSIFSLGFRVAMKGDNEPVMPPSAAQVPKYIHFKDGAGNTIVPTLVPDGLTTPEGPQAGLVWVLDFGSNSAVEQAAADAAQALAEAGTAQTAADAAQSAADAAQASADALATYAVYGGIWDVTDVVTTDTPATIGQFVRVDMTGKASPDVVVITLPLADAGNKGRAVCVTTVNAFGAEDGSIVRILAQGGQLISRGIGAAWNLTSEVTATVVSNGAGWDVQSSL